MNELQRLYIEALQSGDQTRIDGVETAIIELANDLAKMVPNEEGITGQWFRLGARAIEGGEENILVRQEVSFATGDVLVLPAGSLRNDDLTARGNRELIFDRATGQWYTNEATGAPVVEEDTGSEDQDAGASEENADEQDQTNGTTGGGNTTGNNGDNTGDGTGGGGGNGGNGNGGGNGGNGGGGGGSSTTTSTTGTTAPPNTTTTSRPPSTTTTTRPPSTTTTTRPTPPTTKPPVVCDPNIDDCESPASANVLPFAFFMPGGALVTVMTASVKRRRQGKN
jgi:hypothetical protein